NSADLYQPFCPKDEIGQVSRYVAEQIAKDQGGSGRAVESTKTFKRSSGPKPRNEHSTHVPGRESLRGMKEEMIEELERATAVFSVGAGKTMIDGTRPELLTFKELIDAWWKIDKNGNRQRTLIWTLDLGRLDFNDPESRARFMNVSALRSRFKAL